MNLRNGWSDLLLHLSEGLKDETSGTDHSEGKN